MNAKPKPVYLERRTYRRRRMMDAAQMLPILGALLFLLPLLWAGGGTATTAQGVTYVFLIWAGLILVAAWLARQLSKPVEDVSGDAPPK